MDKGYYPVKVRDYRELTRRKIISGSDLQPGSDALKARNHFPAGNGFLKVIY
jgi:hypothetical protein